VRSYAQEYHEVGRLRKALMRIQCDQMLKSRPDKRPQKVDASGQFSKRFVKSPPSLGQK